MAGCSSARSSRRTTYGPGSGRGCNGRSPDAAASLSAAARSPGPQRNGPLLLRIAMDDGACGVGTPAALKGEAEPEVVSFRRLAFGRKHAEERHRVFAAVLLPLIAQREVERRLDVAIVDG